MPENDHSRSYHHGDLRNALKAAALDLIAEEGLERFSLRAASRRVGVSPAAVYRHFSNKEALLAELAEEAAGRLAGVMEERLTASSTDKAEDAPLNRLLALGEGYVLFALHNRRMFHLILGTSLGYEDFGGKQPSPGSPCHGARGHDPFGMLLGVLGELQGQGRLTEPDIVKAALTAWSAVHGLATLLVDDVIRLDDLGTSLDQALASLLRSVAFGLVRPACSD